MSSGSLEAADVRFSFTSEQQMAQASVRALLAEHWPARRLRERWSHAGTASTSPWRELASAGVLGVRIPVELGGSGLDEVDLVLLLEETGRAAVADPVVEVAAVAAPLLAELGGARCRRLLPAVAAGDSRPAVALAAAGGYVLDADNADVLLMQHGAEIHAVDRAAVDVEAQASVDASRRLFLVRWSPSAHTRVLGGEAAGEALSRAFDRGALGTSAQLLGLAERAITMAAGYAREREQFGRPVGSFQAIKHLLANALLELEFARPLTYRAAWSVAHSAPDRGRDVSMAKLRAAAAAKAAARTALQVHGAMGYTWDHDLHLWMKRIWALDAAWGHGAWHEARVAEAVLSP